MISDTSILAHAGHPHAMHDFAGGFLHPLLGLDHLLAIIAAALWAASLGGRAKWGIPCAFLAAMALGALAGLTAGTSAFVEHGIAASVLILGVLAALATRPALPAVLAIVAAFASLHGFAHGVETPAGSSAASYLAGMLASTAALHFATIKAAALSRRARFPLARMAGASIAIMGVFIILR